MNRKFPWLNNRVSVFCAATLGAWSQLSAQQPAAKPVDNAADKPQVIERQDETRFNGIIVRGGHQQIRGTIASQAERLRVDLARLIGDKDGRLKLPFTVQLYRPDGKAAPKHAIVTKIDHVEGQYHLITNVHLAKAPDEKQLRYHLLEMLVYERGLRMAKAPGKGEVLLVRPWVILGLLETMDLRAGRADLRVYRSKLDHLKLMPIETMFATSEGKWKELMGGKSLAFRAVSGALVSALVRQPDGKQGVQDFLGEAATFKGEQENLLRKHFPGMNKSKRSLQKWTHLELAELGTARMLEALTILETDKRLTSILKLRYKDAKGTAVAEDIADYAAVMKLKPEERFAAVAGARAELERLSYRCFPTYRPLLAEYEMVLRAIIQSKEGDIKQRLANLTDTRSKFLTAAKRVRDYLDWYYITQSEKIGGTLKQYRDLSEAIERESKRTKADDAIDRYLDAMDMFYKRQDRRQGRQARKK